ncbi:unnamed protein product [Callosobruchus maculatus]|uniref:DRBM domain-containing protein n=1 Tax=Callosobruchus maculatus TaxID=64391 RepID=A0A653D0H3_CALMS|nr:unnamed protein product [Callosobruchus maculatus]
MYRIILISILASFCTCDLSIEDVSQIFKTSACIQASLASIHPNAAQERLFEESNYKFLDASLTDLTKQENNTRISVLSQLHEIAAYNDVQYQYTLDNEEGPAHSKLFTVSLIIGKEKYTGQGQSLKKAQQSAASLAITETMYPKPPRRKGAQPDSSLTPVALLNDLSTKLGILIKFSLFDGEIGSSKKVKTTKTYFKKLNDSILDEDEIHIQKDLPESKGPFHVKLEVGDGHIFYGVAQTIKEAKHKAAIRALEFFVENKDKMDLHCFKDGSEEKCKEAKQKMKSPISLVYEAGQARQISVEFNIIEESGKSHRKTFVTECIFGDMRTTGEGSSKKESKRVAAENMLANIQTLEPLPLATQLKSITADPKKKKSKKNKVIKSNFEHIKKTAEQLVDSFVSTFGKHNDENTPNQKKDTREETRKKSKSSISYQKTILDLSNFLDTEIQYTDLEDGRYSLLAIHIDPEYLCLGDEQNGMSARENAALQGLKLLNKMGLLELFEGKDDTSIEIGLKDQIRYIMEANVEEDSR